MPQKRARSRGADASWPGDVSVPRQDVDEARDQAAGSRRLQKSYYVTEDIADRANRAVYWAKVHALMHAQQTGEEIDFDALPDSASALVESAMWHEVLRLERLYNDGEPFREVAGGKLKPGPGPRGVSRLKQPRKARPPDSEDA